jgi:hypothetical protein
MVVPVQARSHGACASKIAEVIFMWSVFQMNIDPGTNSPCKEADLMSGFHSGQQLMEDIIFQIMLASAATSISSDAITGAFSFIFNRIDLFESF